MKKFTMSELNEMERDDFVAALGTIFENSPWVADKAWEFTPFYDREAMHTTMMGIVGESSIEAKLSLFRLHPDLASRIQMSEHSIKEQQGAGLQSLSPQQYEHFSSCNTTYMNKFGFPFIIAVKGKSPALILEHMRARMDNELKHEMEQALAEIACITRYRVEECVL